MGARKIDSEVEETRLCTYVSNGKGKRFQTKNIAVFIISTMLASGETV